MVDFNRLKLVADYGFLVGESTDNQTLVKRSSILRDICIDQVSKGSNNIHKNRVKILRELVSEMSPIVDMMRNDILNERMNMLASVSREEQYELQKHFSSNPVSINLPKF